MLEWGYDEGEDGEAASSGGGEFLLWTDFSEEIKGLKIHVE